MFPDAGGGTTGGSIFEFVLLIVDEFNFVFITIFILKLLMYFIDLNYLQGLGLIVDEVKETNAFFNRLIYEICVEIEKKSRKKCQMSYCRKVPHYFSVFSRNCSIFQNFISREDYQDFENTVLIDRVNFSNSLLQTEDKIDYLNSEAIKYDSINGIIVSFNKSAVEG